MTTCNAWCQELTLRAGEVLALLGENGAGKSTLMRMPGGATRPDAGEVRLSGEEVVIASRQNARKRAIVAGGVD